jgi:hypothetical protein
MAAQPPARLEMCLDFPCTPIPFITRAALKRFFLENLSHLITQGANRDPISDTGFFHNY